MAQRVDPRPRRVSPIRRRAPAANLPAHLQARLTERGADTLVPVVTVSCRRYAVDDDQDRLTLDCCVTTDRAKDLGYAVLEFKTTNADATRPGRVPHRGRNDSCVCWFYGLVLSW